MTSKVKWEPRVGLVPDGTDGCGLRVQIALGVTLLPPNR
ncbi:MAG: hypothetical protein QOE57_1870 [Acidimicrobiaceae bacterium]|nr:hypothetical protein [Acidimicrobiaceae bacterium]